MRPADGPSRQRWYSFNPYGPVAQLVEQRIENPRVSGSIPLQATSFLHARIVVPCMLTTLQHGGSVFDALTNAYFYIQFLFFADIVVATTVKKQVQNSCCKQPSSFIQLP